MDQIRTVFTDCVSSAFDLLITIKKGETAMPGYKRITACIIGILMLINLLFSAFYIAAEVDHDCAGEDCPICACIAQCESILHQISDGIVSQAAFVFPIVFLVVSIFLYTILFTQETLVSRRVRLNN